MCWAEECSLPASTQRQREYPFSAYWLLMSGRSLAHLESSLAEHHFRAQNNNNNKINNKNNTRTQAPGPQIQSHKG